VAPSIRTIHSGIDINTTCTIPYSVNAA
jgi:hypothetical protein